MDMLIYMIHFYGGYLELLNTLIMKRKEEERVPLTKVKTLIKI